MTTRSKNILKYSFSVALALGLVAFAFRGVDWEVFLSGFARTRWFWVIMFTLVSVMALLFRTWRWRMLLKVFDPEVRSVEVWDALNIGNFLNTLLPGAGEMVRCGCVTRKGGSFERSVGTMLMERCWDLSAVVIVVVLAIALNWGRVGPFFNENILAPLMSGTDMSLIWIACALLAAAVAACLLLWRFRNSNKAFRWIASVVKGLLQGFSGISSMEHKFFFVLCTVGAWSMYILMSWCGFKALPMFADLTLADAVLISALGNIASIVPVPGGIGAFHYLVALALSSMYGSGWDEGILYATLCHEAHAVFVIIIGALSYSCYIVRRRSSNRTA